MSDTPNNQAPEIPVHVRVFHPDDAAACRALYEVGLIGDGQLASNDTGLDMDDILGNYVKVPGNGFWVAEDEHDHILGMIGVQHHEAEAAEIRRLRVMKDRQRRGIGIKLLERAVGFCLDNGYLKVVLDTNIGGLSAEELFDRFAYKLERTKNLGDGRQLYYFFRDIYARGTDAPRK